MKAKELIEILSKQVIISPDLEVGVCTDGQGLHFSLLGKKVAKFMYEPRPGIDPPDAPLQVLMLWPQIEEDHSIPVTEDKGGD